MEAIRLSVECMQFFRRVLKGTDLMPNIMVGEGWDRLDKLFASYILPVFDSIMLKKGLMTDLDFKLKTDEANISVDMDVKLLIRHTGPTINLSFPNTSQAKDKLRKLFKPAPSKDTFVVPDYKG
jgi:hypothetical protein